MTKKSMNPPLLEASPEAQRVVIFGGTFDPPHEAHIFVIRELLSRGYRTVVIAITEQNPLKKRKATDLATRKEMMEIVLRAENLPVTQDPSTPGVYVSPRGYRFTFEMIDYWRSSHDKEVAWAVGEDLRDEIPSWREIDRLCLPFEIIKYQKGMSSTGVRSGALAAHPALRDCIAERKLYDSSKA